MENTINVRQRNKIKSKIYNRYNWGALAIAIQMLGASVIVSALQVLLVVILVARGSIDTSDKANLMENMMTAIFEYNLPMTGISMIFINTITAVIVLKFSKTCRLRELIRKPAIGALDVVLAMIGIVGISSLDSLIMKGLSFIFGSSSEAVGNMISSGILSDNILVSVISIAYVAVLGPITEEILCRGAVLPTCSHISWRFGIIASALMFGIMHGNISQLFNAFILGLLLAYVTLKSHSIIPACLMHIANNSISVIQGLISEGLSEKAATIFDNACDISLAVLGIICVFFLLKRNKDIDEEKDILPISRPVTDEEIAMLQPVKKGELTAKSFFGSWAFWMAAVYAAFSSAIMMFLM
ncbi:MAG: CPBP family intramembrane metalloprotease [Saccharofermentans sp.]|nr:CPBP family intramembrane metalloprotease [Saccharofermentans sp.]